MRALRALYGRKERPARSKLAQILAHHSLAVICS